MAKVAKITERRPKLALFECFFAPFIFPVTVLGCMQNLSEFAVAN